MPKSGKEFITLLLQKAGVKMDDEKIVNALAAPELATIQISDDLITPVDNGLLSISAAKNNHPEIQSHYKAQIYDGVDKTVARVIDEYKLPDEVKNEILAEKSSTKRIELLTAKLKEEAAKQGNAGKGEKDQLSQEIARLNGELKAVKDKEASIHTDYKKQIVDINMGHALGQLLGSYKTKFDELPVGVKDSTLKAIINNSLAADSAELTVDEAGQIILRKKDGNNFFGDDHTVLTPKTYLDKILARDKILITTDQSQSNGGGANSHNRNNGQNPQRQNQNNNSGNNGNGNGRAASNTAIKSLVDESLAAFTENGQ